jgi:hypothetical protein
MFITHPKENRQHYSSCGAWAATTYYHQEAPELVISMQQFFPKEPSDGSPRVLLLHQGFSYQNLWHKHAQIMSDAVQDIPRTKIFARAKEVMAA